MNWNKLILVGSLALAVFATPVITAQASPRGSFGSGGRGSYAGRGSFAGHGSFGTHGGRTFSGQGVRGRTFVNSGRTGNWHGGNHNWGNHHWGHHHGHYYFPYYAYDPFFYGFGYPYWGGSYYYDGYNNGYYNNGYYGGGDSQGSVAVEVQQALAREGYYHGAIDGVVGDGTRRAIRSYERAHGLPVDGRIDSSLLSTIGVS